MILFLFLSFSFSFFNFGLRFHVRVCSFRSHLKVRFSCLYYKAYRNKLNIELNPTMHPRISTLSSGIYIRFISHLLPNPQAFPFATAFRTISLRCFFANITLKRAKSFNFFRCSMAARLVAQPDLFHFSTIASFSNCFLTTPELAARGSFVRQKEVRVRCLN